MTGLSVGSRTALTSLVDTVSDEVLGLIQSAVVRMPGDKARDLEGLLDRAALDRGRCRTAFAAVIPLFHPRSDGVEALTFPAPVLGRLWRAAAKRNTGLLSLLDSTEADDASRRALARSRLYVTSATLVRDTPEAVWPDSFLPGRIDAPGRERLLGELAGCLDLGMVAHRAAELVVECGARPSADGAVELKLLAQDAEAIDPDGRRRLTDILVAHVQDTPSILRLSVYLAGAAGREALLTLSDTAVFVERVLAAAEGRVEAICDRKVPLAGSSLQQALAWLSSALEGMDLTIQAQAASDWGRRVASARGRVSARLTEQLERVPRTMAAVMPVHAAHTVGRMTRRVPWLEALPPPPSDMTAAQAAADLLMAVRNHATRFGVEAARHAVWTEAKDGLLDYADLTVEQLHATETLDDMTPDDRELDGEGSTEAHPDVEAVCTHILALALLLERMEATGEARAVQRRIMALRAQAERA